MAMSIIDMDLISNLHDDFLLRILAFLPAAEVARTCILSRRWRHLWSLAVALRFNFGSIDPTSSDHLANIDNARKVIATADAALARRGAAGHDVEDLEMRFVYTSEDDPDYCYECGHHSALGLTSARVASWIQFAARRVTGRFTIVIPRWEENTLRPLNGIPGPLGLMLAKMLYRYHSPTVLFAELPSSARFEAMILDLGDAVLTVPAAGAGAFRALADVDLSHARIDAGCGDVGQLFSSSCCPRLRRLHITSVKGLKAFDLKAAGTLEELQLDTLRDLKSINVDAPGLRELRIKWCSSVGTTRISAPRLEVITSDNFGRKENLSFDGAASIRRIEGLLLFSHRRQRELEEVSNDDDSVETSASMWLLQQCTRLNWLAVDVMLPAWEMKMHEAPEYVYEDMIMGMPRFPNVRNLTVRVDNTTSEHRTGATIAKLITKFPKIECLTIDTWEEDRECSDLNCVCNEPKGWEDHEISLEYLRTVEIHDFLPFKSQISFVRLLLASAPILERMTVSLNEALINTRQEETGKDVDFEIPCYGGRWEPCAWECRKPGFSGATKYKWTRGQKGRDVGMKG